jgi:hypothetical protein
LDDLARALFNVAPDAELAGHTLDILSGAGPKLWIDLDSALRPWLYGYRDPRITGAQAVQMTNPLGVMLTACSRDGRDREKAIKHPAMRDDPRLYPVLAIRTTDWATSVQDQATRVLAGVLADADARTLLAILPVAVRLGDRQRGRHAIALVHDALLRADDKTLVAVRGCDDLRGRRFAFHACLEAGRIDQRQLVDAALHETDIISRTRCAETLAAQATSQSRPEVLEELLGSTSARVRVEALTALVRLGRTDSGPRFLADEASMVRLTAQWAVRRAGADPAEMYRQQLAARPENGVRGLLAGLGDCGTRTDADLVLPYLWDPRPRVRAEAVRTLRHLGASIDLAPMLEDPAPVVVRDVVATLRISGPSVAVERLWTLFGPANPRHVRRGAYRLLSTHDAWSRIKADLILITDPGAEQARPRRSRRLARTLLGLHVPRPL